MSPIDLHILRPDDWPQNLLDRAMASTEGQPVNVHVVPYAGHEGRARAEGYQRGSAPYVAFLDADDELIAGGLEALLAALDADPTLCGTYGGEEQHWPDGTRTRHLAVSPWSARQQRLARIPALHNGVLMRREAVTPHLAEIARYPIRSNILLRGLVTQYGPWRAVPVMAYRWYRRPGTLSSRHAHNIQIAIAQRLDPILLAAESRQSERLAAPRTLSGPQVELIQSPDGARVDVHVLAYLESPESLANALRRLESLPCNVWVVRGGFPGHIGAARSFAFGLGESEYVSFVDDDDEIEPEAFGPCLEALESNPACVGVYTDTVHVHPDGRHERRRKRPWSPIDQLANFAEILHLKLMRRAAVMPYRYELTHWPTLEEYVLCGLMAERGDWVHLPIVGANKRVKPIHASSSRLLTAALRIQAMERVRPALLSAARRKTPKRALDDSRIVSP